jgi:DNA-binding NarL/FixJ family response regulator
MRILIVDDHAMVREDLKRILLDEFKDASFGEAGNATEALEQIWKRAWELVLLDVSMHGRSGLDVLKEIRASTSKVPVLVLSGHPEEQYAVRVLKAGAAGYLVKESAPQELCRAVRKILSGGKYPGGTISYPNPVVEPTSTRGPLKPGIPGHAADCCWQNTKRDRRRAFSQRQDRGHVPDPDPRKDGFKE